METTLSNCCGGTSFERLHAAEQAAVLTTLVREARVLQLSLESVDPQSRTIGDQLQHALAQAIDADDEDATGEARQAIEACLDMARAAGLQLNAVLDEALVEGAVGTMRMPVLSAVLSRVRQGTAAPHAQNEARAA